MNLIGPKKILQVFTTIDSTRLNYVLKFIENSFPRIQCHLITCTSEILVKDNLISLNYTKDLLNGFDFNICPNPLLSENKIRKEIPNCFFVNDCWFFFPTTTNIAEIPFDIFSFIFYYLTRYEEYQTKERDEHGRFNYLHSIEYRHKCSVFPIVDYWMSVLLKKLFPKDSFQPNYQFTPTFDIDLAWAFQGRNPILWTLGFGNDLLERNSEAVKSRIANLFGKPDPFDVYDFIFDQFEKQQVNPIFFIPTGKRAAFDKNVDPKRASFRQLVKRFSKYKIGIHPSYLSNEKIEILEEEFHMFKSLFGTLPTASRQHYLKLNFPETYRNLIKNGITKEYSMAYSDQIGYRAGTNYSFFWFDLSKNESTKLEVFPAQIMDVTLRFYKNWTVEESLEKIEFIVNQIKKYGGTFMPIWHNSSFSSVYGWGTEWKNLFEKMLVLGKK